ncbi:hypothetical protein HOF78_02955 [Candidatus Woesearchaeota archaeon]|jgi:hypothetical protein|nr:hypothetical protein [Candidatus Woesearchaeota archaeon]MBT6044497.1 hypothetical protein [Candidatus Woesearchaeota archaeon]
MRQVILEINGLEMVNFSPNNYNGEMNLSYTVDGEKKVQVVRFDLTRKIEILVGSILKFVKSQGDQDVDEDDLVGSLFVKRLKDEDKIEERLLNFFAKLCEKVRFMKMDKNHVNYMKIFHEVRGSKVVLN